MHTVACRAGELLPRLSICTVRGTVVLCVGSLFLLHFPGGLPRRTLSVIPPCDARTFLMPIPCGAMTRGSPACFRKYTTAGGKSQAADPAGQIRKTVLQIGGRTGIIQDDGLYEMTERSRKHSCRETISLLFLLSPGSRKRSKTKNSPEVPRPKRSAESA